MRTSLLSLTALLLSGAAGAETLDSTRDTWIGNVRTTPAGSETVLRVRNEVDKVQTPWVSFPVQASDLRDADRSTVGLSFTLTAKSAGPLTLQLIGVNNVAGCGFDFQGTQFTWADQSTLDMSNNRISDTNCVFDTDPSNSGLQYVLASANLDNAQTDDIVSFTDGHIHDYIRSLGDAEKATFIVRVQGKSDSWANLASANADNLPGPQLGWMRSREVQDIPTHVDTFVRQGDLSGHGDETTIQVKRASNSSTNRVGLLLFKTDESDIADAELQFTPSGVGGSTDTTSTIRIWGLRDDNELGGYDCRSAFGDAVDWADLAYLDGSGDLMDNGSPCLWTQLPEDEGQARQIGQISFDEDDVGRTLSFSSPALIDFLNDNQDGEVVFVLTRDEDDGGLNTFIASKEHPSLPGPRLVTTQSDDLKLEGDVRFIGDNTWNVQGAVGVPMSMGRTTWLEGADLDLEYGYNDDIREELVDMTGYAYGMGIPQDTLFAAFSPVEASYNGLAINWTTAGDITRVDLPVESDRNILVAHGLTYDWHNYLVDGETRLYVDTSRSNFFLHTRQEALAQNDVLASMNNEMPIFGDAANLFQDGVVGTLNATRATLLTGFASDGSFVIRPQSRMVEESVARQVDGNVWIERTQPNKLLNISNNTYLHAGFNGATILKVDEDAVREGGQGRHYILQSATNQQVDWEAKLGGLELGGPLGNVSWMEDRTNGTVAFEGRLVENNMGYRNLRLMPTKDVTVTGHFSSDDNWMQLDGKFGSRGLLTHEWEGSLRVGDQGASFSGTTSMYGWYGEVEADIYADYIYFAGESGYSYNVEGFKVKADIRLEYEWIGADDSHRATLRAQAKACAAGSCDKISVDEVTFTDDGRIRMCVDVPGVGSKCTKFRL